MCSGKGDFQSAFSQQLFIAIHQIFIILRDVVLTKTNTVSFISLTWLLHVGCRFCPFNLFYYRFLAETTSKLLILWEELQPCRQLKQTTMTRWGSETWQFTFCVAVFICCVVLFLQSETVQRRVYKSLKLWSMYADLEESLGTFQVTMVATFWEVLVKY